MAEFLSWWFSERWWLFWLLGLLGLLWLFWLFWLGRSDIAVIQIARDK
jgi:hypothetical protein